MSLSFIQLAGLRAERQDTDKWLERERQKIVEAAREFALQQEQTFNNEVGILEYKLTCKDKELQEMESLLNQLRHNLKSLQQEKVIEFFWLFTLIACLLL